MKKRQKPEPSLRKIVTQHLTATDLIVLGVLFLLLLVHAQKGWITTKDDAFITFRYAEHLAQGHGIVWNIGESPVEGYTNFLFMVLLSVFALFKADLVVVAKIINLLSAVAVFFMLIEIFTRIYRNRYLLYFGLFLFVFPFFTSAQIAGGLETMFYAMLVTLGALLLLRQWSAYERKRQVWFSLALLTMGLTRPEGVLVAGVLILLELGLVDRRHRRHLLLTIALWYVAPAAVYMAARRFYFGYWLPNPFYIKRSDKMLSLVGLLELQHFILTTKLYIGLLCMPFVTEKARKGLLVLAAVFLPSLAVYMFFRPMMNYAFRYYQPYYALMLPVLAAPLALLYRLVDGRLEGRNLPRAWRNVAEASLLVAAILFLCPYTGITSDTVRGRQVKKISNYKEFRYWRQQGMKLEDCHIYIGKLLARYPEYRERYIALGDVGAIPYYSKWKALDMGGLNDVHMAHFGTSVSQGMEQFATKFDLDYVFGKDPAVVMVASNNPVTVDHYASRVLVEDPRFKAYERIVAFEYSALIYEFIYLKKDDPSLKILRDGLVEDAMSRGARQIDAKD